MPCVVLKKNRTFARDNRINWIRYKALYVRNFNNNNYHYLPYGNTTAGGTSFSQMEFYKQNQSYDGTLLHRFNNRQYRDIKQQCHKYLHLGREYIGAYSHTSYAYELQFWQMVYQNNCKSISYRTYQCGGSDCGRIFYLQSHGVVGRCFPRRFCQNKRLHGRHIHRRNTQYRTYQPIGQSAK